MGVTFDNANQAFVFDFEHDGMDDIVTLTGNGYQVEAFGRCFYYGYEQSYLDDVLENGRPRYTQAQKEKVKQSIQTMLDLIHQKDYFMIAGDILMTSLPFPTVMPRTMRPTA